MKVEKVYKNTGTDENPVWESKNGIERFCAGDNDSINEKRQTPEEKKKWLEEHNFYVDDDYIAHLSTTCDGTIFFRLEMVNFLKSIGCTDIFSTGYMGYGENLCGYRYEARGKLPDDIIEVIEAKK